MSRVYDTVEPAVIDEEMLRTAVEEQGPRDEAGKIAKDEGIEWKDVKSLRLDFKNILRIDNLWCFTSLIKLQLDNNIIESIEGLEVLVNLKWLDLSFNNIEVISGLDQCTQLEDLTLYSNRIKKIENLNALTQLQVFSIGANLLDNLHDLVKLRSFRNLRTLNLAGNPLCELPEYKLFVAAHLSQLSYLDYRLIDDQTKELAKDKYYVSVEELLNDERAADRKNEQHQQDEKENEKHMKAFVEHLNGSQLFDSLFSDDTEGQKLNHMPGVPDLLETFKEKFTEYCVLIFELGIQEYEKREEEVADFWATINDYKSDNDSGCKEKISAFEDWSKIHVEHILNEKQVDAINDMGLLYQQKLDDLKNFLMANEMVLVDQLEETIKEFDRQMQEFVGNFLEKVQAHTANLRELENTHNEKMTELGMLTLEKALKNELDIDLPDSLRDLLVDKDTLTSAITTSHDFHLLRIDNREDELTTKLKAWLRDLTEDLHQTEEIERNRRRVLEISNLIEYFKEELDQALDFATDNAMDQQTALAALNQAGMQSGNDNPSNDEPPTGGVATGGDNPSLSADNATQPPAKDGEPPDGGGNGNGGNDQARDSATEQQPPTDGSGGAGKEEDARTTQESADEGKRSSTPQNLSPTKKASVSPTQPPLIEAN